MAQFSRGWIPECQPHVKCSGASATSRSPATSGAALLPGTCTDLAARFSTVAGEPGSLGSWRIPRHSQSMRRATSQRTAVEHTFNFRTTIAPPLGQRVAEAVPAQAGARRPKVETADPDGQVSGPAGQMTHSLAAVRRGWAWRWPIRGCRRKSTRRSITFRSACSLLPGSSPASLAMGLPLFSARSGPLGGWAETAQQDQAGGWPGRGLCRKCARPGLGSRRRCTPRRRWAGCARWS